MFILRSFLLTVILALTLFSGRCIAANLAGSWALKADGTILFRFDVARTANGWTATWIKPEHFDSDGYAYSDIKGVVVRNTASRVKKDSHGDLELIFDDPAAIPATFYLHAVDAQQATETFFMSGGPVFEPLLLTREPKASPVGHWDRQKIYTPPVYRPTNPEMTTIFNADQAVRQNWSSHDHATVVKEDEERRQHTAELLKSGALHSGEDFYHAAFVFQHGNTPNDYLLAHTLAIIAIARGKTDAAWISAATLDRYLMSIQQPQIFGTQYMTPKGGATTQAPFNRDLISDALRATLKVPPLAQQAVQLQHMNASKPTP